MSQKERIKQLFTGRPNVWIPLPEILDMRPRIAQYGPRIVALRREGMNIQNKVLLMSGGKCSWYKYIPATAPTSYAPHATASASC